MSKLNLASLIVAYDDVDSSNNPSQRFVDRRTNVSGIDVSNPTDNKYALSPGETRTLFSGTRSVSIDNTTALDITLNPVLQSVYRISYNSGTAPAFRTARAVSVNGLTLNLTQNNNAVMSVATTAGTWTAVQIGDWVYIPTMATEGVINPLNIINGGYWVVLSKTTTTLNLSRLPGQPFSGVSDFAVMTANSQFQVFSSTGVQIGDSVDISAGFSSVTQQTYKVSAVSASFIEFTSTQPLPMEYAIVPTATGMVFYTNAKRFIRIESDQNVVVRLNGDTGNSVKLCPREVASQKVAWIEKWGPTWQVDVVNKSSGSQVNILLISFE